MIGMEAFYTRQRANEGIKLPLYLPTGEPTEHWIHIRGIDSDEFRLAEVESRRDALRVASIEDPRERAKALEEAKIDLLAHLVIGWSFDKECTHEAVKEFLREAPQIADAIDRAASQRALFFAKESSNSQNSPKPSSDSTNDQKGVDKPSENT